MHDPFVVKSIVVEILHGASGIAMTMITATVSFFMPQVFLMASATYRLWSRYQSDSLSECPSNLCIRCTENRKLSAKLLVVRNWEQGARMVSQRNLLRLRGGSM